MEKASRILLQSPRAVRKLPESLEQSPRAVRGERKRKIELELLANSNLADFLDPDFAAMRSSIFY